jgi:hypothetical protein
VQQPGAGFIHRDHPLGIRSVLEIVEDKVCPGDGKVCDFHTIVRGIGRRFEDAFAGPDPIEPPSISRQLYLVEIETPVMRANVFTAWSSSVVRPEPSDVTITVLLMARDLVAMPASLETEIDAATAHVQECEVSVQTCCLETQAEIRVAELLPFEAPDDIL